MQIIGVSTLRWRMGFWMLERGTPFYFGMLAKEALSLWWVIRLESSATFKALWRYAVV